MATWTLEGVRGLRTVTGKTLRPGGFDLTDRALSFCAISLRKAVSLTPGAEQAPQRSISWTAIWRRLAG